MNRARDAHSPVGLLLLCAAPYLWTCVSACVLIPLANISVIYSVCMCVVSINNYRRKYNTQHLCALSDGALARSSPKSSPEKITTTSPPPLFLCLAKQVFRSTPSQIIHCHAQIECTRKTHINITYIVAS